MTQRHRPSGLGVTLVLALLLGAGTSCSRQTGGPSAPAVVLNTLDDSTVDLGGPTGSPSLVAFFSIDNPLALDALERLDDLAGEYQDKDLELIAVALSSERPELVRTIIHQRQFLFPVAMDPEGIAATAFGDVAATPTVFLISPAGRVMERQEGRPDIAALRATIERF